MWIIGLLIGLAIGNSIGGGFGAVIGAILGAIIAKNIKASDINHNIEPSSYSTDVRIDALEKRVDYLVRLVDQLQQKLNRYEKSEVTSSEQNKNSVTQEEIISKAAESTSVEESLKTPSINLIKAQTEPSQSESAIAPPMTAENTETVTVSAKTRTLPSEPETPSLFNRLFSGNILAKIGVILLFFGIASAIKLAAQNGLFPIQVRLLIGACVAIAMIIVGWNRTSHSQHRMFGLALQGGGFAVFYLIVYFMLGRYQLIDHTFAFLLFMFLGVGCIAAAAKQDGMSLAVLGISGAFIAPIMASSNSGNHIALFSYFTLLNLFILGVNWFKGWRGLNICGFAFTFIIGMAWGIRSYHQEIFLSTELFLITFFVMYSLVPVLFALYKAPGEKVWLDNTIIFGTPIAAAFSQSILMQPYEYGLAWSTLITGFYYLLLSRFLARQQNVDLFFAEKSHLAISIVMLTLVIPLAFGAQLTSALWAIEGAALVWTGIAQRYRLPIYFGLALQLGAGIYFALGWTEAPHSNLIPIFNSFYIGSIIISFAGFASAWLIRKNADASHTEKPLAWGFLPTAWALTWWYGSGINEAVDYLVIDRNEIAGILVFVAASTLVFESIGRKLQWFALRVPILFLTFMFAVITVLQYDKASHMLMGSMLFAFPFALAVFYRILYRHEEEGLGLFINSRHLAMLWLLIYVATAETRWILSEVIPNSQLLPFLALGAIPALSILIVLKTANIGLFPVSTRPGIYLQIGLAPVALLIMFWSFYANFSQNGGDQVVGYLPLLSAFDIIQALVLFSVIRCIPNMHEDRDIRHFFKYVTYILAFIWISAMAARIGHHWFGVAFNSSALYRSLFVQSALSLIWTLSAIALMITATRKLNRNLWFVGFALLALVAIKLLFIDLANVGTAAWTASLIGIALLVLAASYFSPAPPKETLAQEDAN